MLGLSKLGKLVHKILKHQYWLWLNRSTD